VADDGMDPCDLRQARGDEALRHLVEDAVPMFEFAVRTTMRHFELATAEGRVQAMRAVAPIIAAIRDGSMRPEYTRTVAGWLGVEVEQVQAEVGRAGRIAAREARDAGSAAPTAADAASVPEPSTDEVRTALPAPDVRDPVVFVERQLLQTLLQFPGSFVPGDLDDVEPESFGAPAHRAVFDGVRGAGGPQADLSARAWADRVAEAAPLAVRGLVAELAVAPLPTRFDRATGLPERRYVEALLARVHDVSLSRRIADATSNLRRLENDPGADPQDRRRIGQELHRLERARAELRDRAS
jgi:DNA primase